MKYSREKLITDLKLIYENYGEITKKSINASYKEFGTASMSVFDKLGTREELHKLIGVEFKTKSFYDWCVENNHIEFIKAWDYEDNNGLTPKDISFSEHNKYWFVCKKCNTKREYNINSITNMGVILKCPYCNSFEKWCIDNNKSILDRFDYDKNNFMPSEISYGSKKSVYLKCENGKHDSSPYMIKNITRGLTNCECTKCHSLGQWGFDTFGDDFFYKYWDYDKNDVDPFEVAMANRLIYVWIKCPDVDYHGSYKIKPIDLTATKDKITCPYCYNTRVHKFDSLGYLYPEVLELWSDKNKKSPYEFKPKSAQKAWFKCKCGKHSDTLRQIGNAFIKDFDCPDCVKERTESKLEEKVRLYINNDLGLNTYHEHKCSILPLNPKTNRPLPYDNEVVDLKLIIEVHGIQHYEITNFAKMSANKFNTTPEYELKYLQWKDEYKKDYAINHGYKYLDIPYWTEKDESYKTLIDNKINEILQEAV